MAKPQVSEHIKGKYRLVKPMFPGLFEFPGFGQVDFRTISLAQAKALHAATGDRYITPVKDKPESKKRPS